MDCRYSVYEETDDHTLEEALAHEKIILQQIANPPLRIVVRPKISVKKDVLLISASMLLTIALLIPARHMFSDLYFILCCSIAGWIYIRMLIKRILLTMIILYQKYAPESLRGACLFEPCCSEYMKRSIEKYGAGRGFIRGIKRILRCRYPNGGIDEP